MGRDARRPTVRILQIVTVGVVGVLLSSCPDPLVWPDFSGVDLLAGRGFADSVPATGGGTTPAWTVLDALDEAGYVTWEQLDPSDPTDAAAPALPEEIAGAPVFRLELMNLLANGDFEATPVGANPNVGTGAAPWTLEPNTNRVGLDWVVVDEATLQAGVGDATYDAGFDGGLTNTRTITGNRALLLELGPADLVKLDLSAAGALTVDAGATPPPFGAGAEFGLFFNVRGERVTMSLDGFAGSAGTGDEVAAFGASTADDTDGAVDTALWYAFPAGWGEAATLPAGSGDVPDEDENVLVVSQDEATNALIFGRRGGTGEATTVLVDNVQLVRVDKVYRVEVAVPLNDPLNDRPVPVEGGTYRVGLWVADDPASALDADATIRRPNAYPARYLAIRAEQAPATSTTGARRSLGTLALDREAETDGGDALWPEWQSGEWQFVSFDAEGVELAEGTTIDAAEIILSISISGACACPAASFPGSILVANPTLEYRVDSF